MAFDFSVDGRLSLYLRTGWYTIVHYLYNYCTTTNEARSLGYDHGVTSVSFYRVTRYRKALHEYRGEPYVEKKTFSVLRLTRVAVSRLYVSVEIQPRRAKACNRFESNTKIRMGRTKRALDARCRILRLCTTSNEPWSEKILAICIVFSIVIAKRIIKIRLFDFYSRFK